MQSCSPCNAASASCYDDRGAEGEGDARLDDRGGLLAAVLLADAIESRATPRPPERCPRSSDGSIPAGRDLAV